MNRHDLQISGSSQRKSGFLQNNFYSQYSLAKNIDDQLIVHFLKHCPNAKGKTIINQQYLTAFSSLFISFISFISLFFSLIHSIEQGRGWDGIMSLLWPLGGEQPHHRFRFGRACHVMPSQHTVSSIHWLLTRGFSVLAYPPQPKLECIQAITFIKAFTFSSFRQTSETQLHHFWPPFPPFSY